MLTVKQKILKSKGVWFVILEEQRKGFDTPADYCPSRNDVGWRSGAFLVTDEWLKKANLSRLILNVTLSHTGQEQDRVMWPGTNDPYIDVFGQYVYTTSTIGHELEGRKDTDNRFQLDQRIPADIPLHRQVYNTDTELSDTTIADIMRF